MKSNLGLASNSIKAIQLGIENETKEGNEYNTLFFSSFKCNITGVSSILVC